MVKLWKKDVQKKIYLWCQVPSHEVCMSGTPIKIGKKKKQKKNNTLIGAHFCTFKDVSNRYNKQFYRFWYFRYSTTWHMGQSNCIYLQFKREILLAVYQACCANPVILNFCLITHVRNNFNLVYNTYNSRHSIPFCKNQSESIFMVQKGNLRSYYFEQV